MEAVWAYRHRPNVQGRVLRRQKALALSEEARQIAWKAQQRLYKRFVALTARGKTSGQAMTALARELLGFLWRNRSHQPRLGDQGRAHHTRRWRGPIRGDGSRVESDRSVGRSTYCQKAGDHAVRTRRCRCSEDPIISSLATSLPPHPRPGRRALISSLLVTETQPQCDPCPRGVGAICETGGFRRGEPEVKWRQAADASSTDTGRYNYFHGRSSSRHLRDGPQRARAPPARPAGVDSAALHRTPIASGGYHNRHGCPRRRLWRGRRVSPRGAPYRRTGSVTSVDIDPAALQNLRDRAAAEGLRNVECVEADIHSFEPGRRYDAVVGRHILIHTKDPLRVLATCRELLQPQGIAAFQEYDFQRVTPSYPASVARRHLRGSERLLRTSGSRGHGEQAVPPLHRSGLCASRLPRRVSGGRRCG